MTVSDLDLVQHPARIEGGIIVVRHLMFAPDEFVFSGLTLVSYSAEEEKELTRLGVLSDIPRDYGRLSEPA